MSARKKLLLFAAKLGYQTRSVDEAAQRLGVDGHGEIDRRRFKPGYSAGVKGRPAALATLLALHELARDAHQKRRQRAAFRIEFRRMMNQTHKDISGRGILCTTVLPRERLGVPK